MGIADNVPPNVKFAVLGLTLPVFIIDVLVLAGCMSTSPGIPALYLFLLKVNEVTLRVGYFAVCAVDAANSTNIPISKNGTANATDGTICVPTIGLDPEELSVKLFGNTGGDLSILNLALTLQRQILVPLVLVATFLMLFGAILFALAKVTQMKLKDPSAFAGAMKQLGIFKPATLALIWMSVLFGFAAAVASTMAIGALNFIIPQLATNVTVTGGKLLQALQYLSFVFGALFALGATIMLSDKLEQQQGLIGEEGSPLDEKSREGMEDGQEGQEGQMEGQEPQYGEPQLQYGEDGQPLYDEEGQPIYAPAQGYEQQPDEQQQQQQQYAEGGEYPQEGAEYTPEQYEQMQQQQQQQQYEQEQQQYQQQQQQPQQPYP